MGVHFLQCFMMDFQTLEDQPTRILFHMRRKEALVKILFLKKKKNKSE